MPFLYPAVFVTGLVAAAIPVIIHLLNRRRFRMLDWAAMQFLLDSVRRNRRRLRIEELILLALRCLLLLALAAGLARFTGCRAMTALPGGAASQTAVLVLDDSYSMGQRVGAGTIFAAATTDLAEQIRKLSQADKLAILLTSAAADDEPFFKPTHVADAEVETLCSRLAGLTPSDGRADLARALSAGAAIFRDDRSVSRRLYVCGDFRRADLADPGRAEAIRKAFDELRKLNVELVAMDFGRKPAGNLTIESMEMIDRFALAGVPTRVRLEVRNHGESPARDVEVRVKATIPSERGPQDIELPAGALDAIEPRDTRGLEFQLTCPQAGPAALTAWLPPDELEADNAAHLALDVRAVLRVLAVDGGPDLSDPTESESFFFVHALDPERNGSEGTKVDVAAASALGEMALDGYDVVALINVGELPMSLDANGQGAYPQIKALTEFVRGGGGLAIFTGERVNPAFYNGPLYAGGRGLSPLRVGPRKGDGDRREQFFRLDPKSIAGQAVMKVFRDYLAAGADPTRFIRFYAFTSTNPAVPPGEDPDVRPPRILASFADDDRSPAAVARQFGKGAVVAFYSTAGMGWNDWPADENGTFVAVLNDLVSYLAKPQEGALSARVGEPIVLELPRRLRDATATLKTPLHPVQPLVTLAPVQAEIAPAGSAGQVLRYDRADRAGRYAVDLALPDGSTRRTLYARSVDPAEGDLTCGRQAGLAAALAGEQFTYVDRTGARPGQVERAQPRKEYWTWALALLAVLLAAETFLGQRFGHYPAAGRKEADTGPAART